MEQPLLIAALAVCLPGTIYLVVATLAAKRHLARRSRTATVRPPITVLKPLAGDEPRLYENLRSFCEQDYPEFQIVFGVRDPSDPAIAVVKRLMADLPDADLRLVCDERIDAPNLKVGKLERMLASACHDLLVIADSDVGVQRDYLAKVVAPFADPSVGLVTCAFVARPDRGFWSRLRSMWFNLDFFPSVVFSRAIGVQKGCFGATMALRRSMLQRVGGFAAIRDQLADDCALGAAVRNTGKRVALPPYLVSTTISKPDFRSLLLHELRWGRTLRTMEPVGYSASVVTHPVALALVGLVVTGGAPPFALMLAVAVAVRLWMALELQRGLRLEGSPLWLVPLRDLLSLALFVASLWGSSVVWRDRRLQVDGSGRLVAEHSRVGS